MALSDIRPRPATPRINSLSQPTITGTCSFETPALRRCRRACARSSVAKPFVTLFRRTERTFRPPLRSLFSRRRHGIAPCITLCRHLNAAGQSDVKVCGGLSDPIASSSGSQSASSYLRMHPGQRGVREVAGLQTRQHYSVIARRDTWRALYSDTCATGAPVYLSSRLPTAMAYPAFKQTVFLYRDQLSFGERSKKVHHLLDDIGH